MANLVLLSALQLLYINSYHFIQTYFFRFYLYMTYTMILPKINNFLKYSNIQLMFIFLIASQMLKVVYTFYALNLTLNKVYTLKLLFLFFDPMHFFLLFFSSSSIYLSGKPGRFFFPCRFPTVLAVLVSVIGVT